MTAPWILDPRPSRDQILLRQAEIVAERSTCDRAHVGAILAHEGRTIASGYNGAPVGMAHCRHECDCSPANVARGWRVSINDQIHEPSCALNQPCLAAVHAEVNTIAFAARYGVSTLGSTLYVTLAPCRPCAQLVINAGVQAVWFVETYRDKSGVELLEKAGVNVRWAGHS